MESCDTEKVCEISQAVLLMAYAVLAVGNAGDAARHGTAPAAFAAPEALSSATTIAQTRVII